MCVCMYWGLGAQPSSQDSHLAIRLSRINPTPKHQLRMVSHAKSLPKKDRTATYRNSIGVIPG